MIHPKPQNEHKTYISGKVAGIPIENIEKKFKIAEKYLVSIGMVPINPIKNGLTEKNSEHEHLIKDLPLLLKANSIYILDNWFDSKKSRIELKIAQEYGITVMYESVIIKHQLKTESIKEAIFEVLGLQFEQYITPCRKTEYFFARIIFANYCSEFCQISLTDIGSMLNRGHATIIYSIKTFKNEMHHNTEFRENVIRINEILSK